MEQSLTYVPSKMNFISDSTIFGSEIVTMNGDGDEDGDAIRILISAYTSRLDIRRYDQNVRNR